MSNNNLEQKHKRHAGVILQPTPPHQRRKTARMQSHPINAPQQRTPTTHLAMHPNRHLTYIYTIHLYRYVPANLKYVFGSGQPLYGAFIWWPRSCQMFLRGECMRIAAASMPLAIPDGDALRVYTKALQCQMEYEVMRLLHNAHVFVNES